jgi:hypothetical protein
VHGNYPAIVRDDFLGFHVDSLCEFALRRWAQFAFANYVCGRFDFRTVGEGVERMIESGGRTGELEAKSSDKEESAKG